METPGTLRRNPPRKAKTSSVEKSSAKDLFSSTRKRLLREGKPLAFPPDTVPEQDNPPAELQELPRPALAPRLAAVDIHHAPLEETAPISIVSNVPHAVLEETMYTKAESDVPALDCDASTAQNKLNCSQKKHGFVDKLSVYLRIRPPHITGALKHTKMVDKSFDGYHRITKIAGNRATHKKSVAVTSSLDAPDVCLVAQGSTKVTLRTPVSFSGARKPKVEEFDGFSQVFGPDCSQDDVFAAVLVPRLLGLLNGESSLVVAMGPTSAGKTHTMLGNSVDPGLLPRSLQYLLNGKQFGSTLSTRKVIISMFEIYSEQGGRSEKLLDLLQDAAELSLQHFKVKGLHEMTASTVQQAECILLNGLQRRTTASTAANECSSRSHCIINISTMESDMLGSNKATLTIADLAGFEREKKTGNQGIRLNESNFINNTSMVFGQCLRALLEHQRNPKKALQKHFQYSMLTRYLKTYLEAKGNMTLIVNVSPCDEDYFDTAFVLRQAAPYSNIRLSVQAPLEAPRKPMQKRKGSVPKDRQPVEKRRKMSEWKSIEGKVGEHVTADFVNESSEGHTIKGLNGEGGNAQSPCSLNSCGERIVPGFSTAEMIQRSLHPLPCGSVEITSKLADKVDEILQCKEFESNRDIRNALCKLIDHVLQQEFKIFKHMETRLRKQQEEITGLKTDLLKEKELSAVLIKVVEDLKAYNRNLESQTVNPAGDLQPNKRRFHSSPPRKLFRALDENANVSIVVPLDEKLTVDREQWSSEKNAGIPALCALDKFGPEENSLQRCIEGPKNELNEENCSLQQLDILQRSCELIDSKDGNEDNRHNASSVGNSFRAQSTGGHLGKLVSFSEIGRNRSPTSMFEPGADLVNTQANSQPKSLNLHTQDRPVILSSFSLQSEVCELDSVAQSMKRNNPTHIQAVDEVHPAGDSHVSSQHKQLEEENILLGAISQNKQFEESNILINNGCDEHSNPPAAIGDYMQKPLFSSESSRLVGVVFSDDECTEHNAFISNNIEKELDSQVKTGGSVETPLFVSESCRLIEAQAQTGDGLDKLSLALETCRFREVGLSGHSMLLETLHLSQDDLAGSVCSKDLEDLAVSDSQVESGAHLPGDPREHAQLPSTGEATTISEDQTGSTIPTKSFQSLDSSCPNGKSKSNLEDTRLLELRQMKGCRLCGKDCSPKILSTSISNNLSLLGPIGLALKDILGVGNDELENVIGNPAAAFQKKLADLMLKSNGVLDINYFQKRFSPQRKLCLRYLLAVFCRKVNVDGKWLDWADIDLPSRCKRFQDIIQVPTVGEAVQIATTGFEEEGIRISTLDLVEGFGTRRQVITSDSAQKVGMSIDTEDKGKENRKCLPLSDERDKLSRTSRWRKLQPLSALALQTRVTYSDTEYLNGLQDDGTVPVKECLEGHVSARIEKKATNSLADLLTRQRI